MYSLICISKVNKTMKQLLMQYAAYNLWAHQRLADVALQLSEKQQNQEIISSFASIQKTFQHILNAESIWWQRLKLQEHIIVPDEKQTFSLQEIVAGLLGQSEKWKLWVDEATETALQHVFAYYNSKKEYFKQPVWQMLVHLFNHGTYHRGQLVTMYRQLGLEKIPPTDFIEFSRKR